MTIAVDLGRKATKQTNVRMKIEIKTILGQIISHSDGTQDIVKKLSSSCWERSGSVVECLTQDRWAVGLSLTNVTVLCP